MSHEEYVRRQWAELATVLENILHEHIGLTEGCRKVVHVLNNLGERENILSNPFVGYDSESDAYPLGDVRKLWSEEGLANADREREKTEAHYKDWVFDAARKLLEVAYKQSDEAISDDY